MIEIKKRIEQIRRINEIEDYGLITLNTVLFVGGVEKLIIAYDYNEDENGSENYEHIIGMLTAYCGLQNRCLIKIEEIYDCSLIENDNKQLLIQCEIPYLFTIDNYFEKNNCFEDELESYVNDLCLLLDGCLNLIEFPLQIPPSDFTLVLKKNNRRPYPSLCLLPTSFLMPIVFGSETYFFPSFAELFQLLNEKLEDKLSDICSSIETEDIETIQQTIRNNAFIAQCKQNNEYIQSFDLEGLELIKQISEGSSGIVMKVIDHKKKSFALKESSEIKDDTIEKEAFILQKLDHPNIIKCHGFRIEKYSFYGQETEQELVETKEKGYLLLEYCKEGSLRQYLDYFTSISRRLVINEVKLIYGQIVSACKYLFEECRMVHRDLKLDNILLQSGLPDVKIKLCDFGFGRTYCDEMNTKAGTPVTADVRILNNETYGPESDLYSLGCILYYLSYRKYPFQDFRTTEDLVRLINSEQVRYDATDCNDQQTQPMNDLMKQLLVPYKKRIGWKEFLSNPFVQECLMVNQ